MTTEDKNELRAAAQELQDFSHDLNEKFAEAKQKHEQRMARLRFFSSDRKYFWRMPAWLWLPLVTTMVALFLFALYRANS